MKDVKYELDQFKKENLCLTTKLQTYGEENSHASDKNQQLERQLLTALEKNKFCQSEVAQRDQTIINLKSELSSTNEKHHSSLQEINIQTEEIDRLNSRIKAIGYDLKEVQAIKDHLETRNNGLEQKIQQRDYDIEVHKKDLAKQEKQIENIKSEWSGNIRNYEEEIKGYKQNFQILNEELSHTKADLSEFMSRINLLKQQTVELNSGLERKSHENESLRETIRRLESVCKEQGAKINEYINELTLVKNRFEVANNQVENLCLKLNDAEQKEELSHKANERLEVNLKGLQETIIELKFKNVEKEQALEGCKLELGDLKNLVNNKNSEIKRLQERMQELNEDLDKVTFDLTKVESNLSSSEMTAKTHFAKLSEKINDVS